MQLLRLTVFSSFLFLIAFSFTSCEKYDSVADTDLYTKTDIPFTGAQSVPPTTSNASGKLNVTYRKSSRILEYNFSWAGLSDTIRGIEIYGPAPSGYMSTAMKQAILGLSPNLKTNQATYPYQGGSYTGTLFVDGVMISENDLLNHLYYISIRTKTYGAAIGAPGEIRAQIRFQ